MINIKIKDGEKRYVCFVCYSYHPEMKGVSEEEFNAGNNVCKEEKCKRKGQYLDTAIYCEKCNKLFPPDSNHKHDSKCEICHKELTKENTTMMEGVCDECAGQHAKSVFF